MRITRAKLAVAARALLSKVRIEAGLQTAQRFRRNWPQSPAPASAAEARFGVVIASCNTRECLSWLLFSLLRVLPRERLARIVVVDNASTDGSRELLAALARAGLVDAIFNARQRQHGPALNQGIRRLRALHAARADSRDRVDYLWVLDSDTIVLRGGVLDAVLPPMLAAHAALAGERLDDGMATGYAHPACLVLRPERIWRRSIEPFDGSGAPGVAMQQRLVRRGIPRLFFPFMTGNHVLHLGATSLRAVWERDERNHELYQWAKEHHTPHFHGNPFGKRLLEEFLEVFEREGAAGGLNPFMQSVLRGDRIVLSTPGALSHPAEPRPGTTPETARCEP